MAGSETVFASASHHPWHSICTHHFLTAIPSSVHQHQHSHDGKTVLTKHWWLCVEHLCGDIRAICSHSTDGKETFFRFEAAVSWHHWRGCRIQSVDYTYNAKLSFILNICGKFTTAENYTSRYLIFNMSVQKTSFGLCFNIFKSSCKITGKSNTVLAFTECSVKRREQSGNHAQLMTQWEASNSSGTNQH